MATPSTIILTGDGCQRKEGIASEAITPGHVIEFGGSNDVQKHSNDGGNVAPIFAIENDIAGDGIDVAYASGDQVLYYHAQRGDVIYAYLADGENASKGDYLSSNGDGTLKVHADPAAASNGTLSASESLPAAPLVGFANEAVDLSASSNTADGRIKITVL